MPANALVQTRIDAAVKERAAAVLEELGITVSDAVRILLTRTANEGALPFALASDSAAHDAWFRTKVKEALDDQRSGIPNDEVEAHFRPAALRRPAPDPITLASGVVCFRRPTAMQSSVTSKLKIHGPLLGSMTESGHRSRVCCNSRRAAVLDALRERASWSSTARPISPPIGLRATQCGFCVCCTVPSNGPRVYLSRLRKNSVEGYRWKPPAFSRGKLDFSPAESG